MGRRGSRCPARRRRHARGIRDRLDRRGAGAGADDHGRAEGFRGVYEWDAGGASLTFEFHGEPAAGPQGAFLSFEKGSAAKGAGTLKAPFAGTHGWYWRNPTAATVVVRLKVSGFHTDMKRI